MHDLLTVTERGLYCEAGDFYIDPWRPVQRAIITHAHGDHLRSGSSQYWLTHPSARLAQVRLPRGATLQGLEYGQAFSLGSTEVSLHPAGHILGSAQIRIAAHDQVWVVSGDYKRAADPTCAAFESVPCNVFISEATFALPVYRWPPATEVALDIFNWWQSNREQNIASVLFVYALGKAQRVLAELTRYTNDTVYLHGAMQGLVDVYREYGVQMLPTLPATVDHKQNFSNALILAPPSAAGSKWLRRFGDHATGFCSGWMRLRGVRRRRGYDRGFVLSDHADWPALLQTIRESQAERVLLTHGATDTLARYLQEQGINASALQTAYGDEH